MSDRIEIETKHTHFVVVALGYWGKATTLKQAKKNCILSGAMPKEKMIAFWGSDDITVDGGGTVTSSKLLSLGEI